MMESVSVSENSHIWLQSILTFFIGLISFIITQFLVLFFFKPIKDFKKSLGDAYEKVEFAKNKYNNPIIIGKNISQLQTQAYINSSDSLRTASARIMGLRATIPLYKVVYRIFRLPSDNELHKISKSLIYLHNSHWRSSDDDWFKFVEKAEKDFYQSAKFHFGKE